MEDGDGPLIPTLEDADTFQKKMQGLCRLDSTESMGDWGEQFATVINSNAGLKEKIAELEKEEHMSKNERKELQKQLEDLNQQLNAKGGLSAFRMIGKAITHQHKEHSMLDEAENNLLELQKSKQEVAKLLQHVASVELEMQQLRDEIESKDVELQATHEELELNREQAHVLRRDLRERDETLEGSDLLASWGQGRTDDDADFMTHQPSWPDQRERHGTLADELMGFKDADEEAQKVHDAVEVDHAKTLELQKELAVAKLLADKAGTSMLARILKRNPSLRDQSTDDVSQEGACQHPDYLALRKLIAEGMQNLEDEDDCAECERKLEDQSSELQAQVECKDAELVQLQEQCAALEDHATNVAQQSFQECATLLNELHNVEAATTAARDQEGRNFSEKEMQALQEELQFSKADLETLRTQELAHERQAVAEQLAIDEKVQKLADEQQSEVAGLRLEISDVTSAKQETVHRNESLESTCLELRQQLAQNNSSCNLHNVQHMEELQSWQKQCKELQARAEGRTFSEKEVQEFQEELQSSKAEVETLSRQNLAHERQAVAEQLAIEERVQKLAEEQQSQVAGLRLEISHVTGAKQESAHRNESLECTCLELRQQLAQDQSSDNLHSVQHMEELQSWQKQCKELQAGAAIMMQAQRQSHGETEVLVHERERLQGHMAEANEMRQEAAKEMQKLQEELQSSKHEVAALRTERVAYGETLEAERVAYERQAEQHLKLEKQHPINDKAQQFAEEQQREVAGLRQQISDVNAVKQKVAHRNEELESTCSQLQQQLAQNASLDDSRKREELQSWQKQCEELQGEASVMMQAQQRSHGELESQVHECAQLQRQVAEANKMRVEAANQVHQGDHTDLEQRNAELQLQCNDMRKQVASVAQNGLEALESSTTMQEMNVDLQRQCQEFREQLSHRVQLEEIARSCITQSSERVHELERQCAQLRERSVNYAQVEHSGTMFAEELRAKCVAFRAECEEWRLKAEHCAKGKREVCNSVQGLNEELKSECTALRKQVVNAVKLEYAAQASAELWKREGSRLQQHAVSDVASRCALLRGQCERAMEAEREFRMNADLSSELRTLIKDLRHRMGPA